MSTFPTSIPSYLGFTATHTLATDTHAAQHNQEQADIIAIATKMGTGSSTPSSGNVLAASGTGTSSWSQVNLTSMITGVLSVTNGGTGQSSIASFISNAYPVGCIYTEVTGVNPGTTFGFGTWVAFGAGRVLVGNGSSDQAFTAGTTGGESNHLLTTGEMPSHNHALNARAYIGDGAGTAVSLAVTGASFIKTTTDTTANAGSGSTHNNLQPYLVVYFWQRTA